jgi:hypothetical protein
MSVINQVLLNLEKRRASAAERGVLPNHVQVLPDSGRVPHWGWVAASVSSRLRRWQPGWRSRRPTRADTPLTAVRHRGRHRKSGQRLRGLTTGPTAW